MHIPTATDNCLNCGEALHGSFCGWCGQRAIPPYPTMREMVGDAWQELSGYDGRFARTFRMLVGRPGAMTREILEGRRARYISPVRLYLVASVAYFLVAAAAPNLRKPPAAVVPGSKINIDLTNPDDGTTGLSPEQRAEVLKQLERAPWGLSAVLRPVILDPVGFRNRFLANLPRVLFVLVPVFAGIVSLFYRRRRFAQHLVFALHLHATIFVGLTIRELSNFTRHMVVVGIVDVAVLLFLAWYGLIAFRRVYGDQWPLILMKSAGTAVIYFIAGMVALVATLVWAAVMSGPGQGPT